MVRLPESSLGSHGKQLLARSAETLRSAGAVGRLLSIILVYARTNTDGLRLLQVLHFMRPLQSSNPRDKIFAALGLSKDAENAKADHSQEAETGFRNYAVDFIRNSSSLHIFGHCLYFPRATYSTRAPDWSNKSALDPISGDLFAEIVDGRDQNPAIYTAGGAVPLKAGFKGGNRILGLQSGCLGLISFVASTVSHPLSEWGPCWKHSEDLFPILDRAGWEYNKTAGIEQFKTAVYNISEQSFYHELVLTILGDVPYAAGDNWKRLRSAEAQERGRLKPLRNLEAISLSGGRRFAVSRLGSFCLVPEEAKPRDLIVVVAGGEVLLLLRPQQDSNYHLTGECYVHGIMDGEAMDWIMKDGGLQEILII